MPVVNRDRYPDDEFLPQSKLRQVGFTEGEKLILVGYEAGTKAAIVAKTTEENFKSADLVASYLYELVSHSQGSIELYEDLKTI